MKNESTNIVKEAEILEAAIRILSKTQNTVCFNQTIWAFLEHAMKHLHAQFKAEFNAVYRQDEILEAQTLEVSNA